MFTVSIVGRPNVGKSTLFNRITGKRKAITSKIAGTTRDRVIDAVSWDNKDFILIDTAGALLNYEKDQFDEIDIESQGQIDFALNESDLVLFVIDGKLGMTDKDKVIANKLRVSSSKIILVVNKTDNFERQNLEVVNLGFEKVVFVSGISGKNVNNLLDDMVALIPRSKIEKFNGKKVAIIGRPNVGKSTLFNKIIGEHRAIVSDVPGTTRDCVDSKVTLKVKGAERTLMFIDTAGIRKRGSIEKGIEKYSVMRSVEALERANVVMLVADANEGMTRGDAHLAELAIKEKKDFILVINKVDIETEKMQYLRFPFMAKQKIIYISAKTGENLGELINYLFKL